MNLTPEQLAEYMNAGLAKALSGVLATLRELRTENKALRADLDITRNELQRLTAKSAGGAALMPRR